MTPKRINTFIGDGTATQFKVDATDLDATAVTAEVNGSAVTVSAVNRSTGLVTLAAAPANGNGLANVSIAFAKTVSGHADKINKCRFAGLYGGKNDTRVFLSGNPDEPDCDWQSGLYDPTYFPGHRLHPAWVRTHLRSSAISSSTKVRSWSSPAAHRRRPVICAPT